MEVNNEQAILEAAEKLFLERGFALTSTADIASLAGCNTALIHYYYRTKSKLFETVFRAKIRLFIDGFLNIELSNLDFEQKIRAIVEGHFDFISANRQLPFLLINEFTTNPAAVDDLKNEIGKNAAGLLDLVQQAIDQDVASGKINNISAADLIFTIASLNVMTFLLLPVLTQVGLVQQDEFLITRKKEIVQTIVNSLKI
ncbi:MAG: TetR/AcrR family transcriptional regulator [Mucinivorans sp.]